MKNLAASARGGMPGGVRFKVAEVAEAAERGKFAKRSGGNFLEKWRVT
jgi:hypothetical protein